MRFGFSPFMNYYIYSILYGYSSTIQHLLYNCTLTVSRSLNVSRYVLLEVWPGLQEATVVRATSIDAVNTLHRANTSCSEYKP